MNSVAVNDQRKSERIEYAADIQCYKIITESEVRTFDPPVEMNIKNISTEGLCINSSESFAEKSLLKFDIILENRIYRNVAAIVIWKTNHHDTYYYGVQFQNITGKLGIHIIEIGRKVFRRI